MTDAPSEPAPLTQCVACHPIWGIRCTRRANGHDDHEATRGDATLAWRAYGVATYKDKQEATSE